MWQLSNDQRLKRLAVFTMVEGSVEPIGELIVQVEGWRRSFFRYTAAWRKRKVALFPAGLPLRRAAIHSQESEAPVAFYDSVPDAWGRSILDAVFCNHSFGIAEYLAVTGSNRTGELMIGPSFEAGPQRWLPAPIEVVDRPATLAELEEILVAATAFDVGDADEAQTRLLLRAADIGGARPKARVQDGDCEWIAKFPAHGDRFDHPRLEALCLSLASAAGIDTPAHRLLRVGAKTVLLVRRFDRSCGERLGYFSAASLVGQSAVRYSTDVSYSLLAKLASDAGIRPCAIELFRRLLFNCCINNTDDHLRNHAFIRDRSEWVLSPVFDLVPGFGSRLVLRPAPGYSPSSDVEVALTAAGEFGLTQVKATAIWHKMQSALSGVAELADAYELSRSDREQLFLLAPTLRAFCVGGRG